MVLARMQHHPHHGQQGPAPTQHLQHPRPSSIVQQHQPSPSHHHQQHHSPYQSTHSIPPVYQTGAQQQSAQHAQEIPQYYGHPSPYSTPGATSGYTSAETPEMMAAAQIPRPYPPMSYHTPQSNSPASVASPSGHDQHRSLYAQPASQIPQQSMYYPTQQPQYSSMNSSMTTQAAPSHYAQHAQQPHQSMTSQPGMMMSHQQAAQHQIPQHATQHAQTAGMAGSPRTHTKMEPQVPQVAQVPQVQQVSHVAAQMQRPPSGPIGTPQQQHPQNGAPLSTPTGSAPGVNPNAAPGPIPATTPLVVRQDGNGVQWIAFEYSRDRVKMEYTIRCDVESVNTDELSEEFKAENCVYPRACCPKDQYRGNRLVYETECNTVGWALAQLNSTLRGKRGLIQRAVDSWRNSNQDPRLRSRRVRRMAKMNNRKAVSATPHPAHMAGPTGPTGMPTPGGMSAGGPAAMGKPGMPNIGAPMHQSAQGSGDEVGDGDSYMDDQHTHHHQAPAGGPARGAADVRQNHVFSDYNNYPAGSSASMGGAMGHGGHSTIQARRSSIRDDDSPSDLFPDMPEAKKRKFILVEDNARGSNRLRVRVTLDAVDTKEIPDSFRKNSSVYPHSYFPREMQSPPPSATGSRFFLDDQSDDGRDETEPVANGRNGRGKTMVKVPIGDGAETELAIPRMRRSMRGKEVRLNDLGYRMAWLQSRVFAGRTIFLQRALDCYRNKTRSAIESIMQDVKTVAPHYETRVGKRKWNERMKRAEKKDDDA